MYTGRLSYLASSINLIGNLTNAYPQHVSVSNLMRPYPPINNLNAELKIGVMFKEDHLNVYYNNNNNYTNNNNKAYQSQTPNTPKMIKLTLG